MPNHVTTRCTVSGPKLAVEAFKSALFTNAEIQFDFELIKPMPPILQRVISPRRTGPNGRTMLEADENPRTFHGVEATEEEEAALRAIPFESWYDWSVEHWGTKWGSYSVAVINDGAPFVFKFDTAWSFPVPIFEAMAERFPELTFDCLTFDEGWNFAGKGQFGASASTPFVIREATSDLYLAVYGEPPEAED